jgi:hypothetical protein
VGFNDFIPVGFFNIIFEVQSVIMVNAGPPGKSKISSFIFTPADTVFSDELEVSFDIHQAALLNILVRNVGKKDSVRDTTSALDKPGTSLHYYYTLDGTDPRTSATRIDYTEPFIINATTTVKAYAAIEGDTNWYPSEVVTRTYTKEGSTAVVKYKSPSFVSAAMRNGTLTEVFDISGRRVGNGFSRRGGVVLYRLGGKVFRQVMVR